MKTLTSALVIVLSLVLSASAEEKASEGGAPEKFVLAQVTDRAEVSTYELMGYAAYQDLVKQLALEGKLHMKALMAAEKAWKADETNKKTFPKSAIAVRKVKIVKEFTDSGKASDELAKLEAKESDKAAADKERQAAREKDKQSKGLSNKEQIAKDQKKDAEKDALYGSARTIYDDELNKLLAAAGGEPANAPAAPAAPAKEEKKKEEPKKK